MTKEDINQLKLEIDHIFQSGANEIRILNMVVTFIDKRNPVNTLISSDNEIYIKGYKDGWRDCCKDQTEFKN